MNTVRGGLLALWGALLVSAFGCSHPQVPTTLTKVSGDNQIGVAGQALTQPLVVRVTDASSNPVSGVTVLWTVQQGGGAVSTLTATTGDDGLASAIAKLGPAAASNVYQASTQSWSVYSVSFAAGHSPFTLDYTDPVPGGGLRLVKHPGSDPSGATVDLDLVVAPGVGISAYSVGYNLPLDATKVALDQTTPMTWGTALNPGSNPPAAMAALPQSGPLKGTLVTGLSQKAAGTGAVATDTMLTAGAVLYTVRLDVLPSATPGVVFDGTTAGFALRSAGARNQAGTTVAMPADVVIGRLVVK